ncbi:adenosylcobinamide-GDP ribazoletransferase [Egibacter rhizosphaerae]|uniref:Adenosylcobinamide-GDP ribazoletransferase n=1 Tax=Egibacter rhizosphaerae TaxID=1670831 RepID=A0A411YJI4_9ACTN|nr:adenosylcobinamide-GDP ribazoletransferase [Egibacter rhizosphaerae]QBI21393.1 adenosylcobinamide-GDP ribazoletransferase [Egibacter rhizosphaerae]
MHETVRLTAVAFQFLTRLPVPAVPVGPGDLRRAMGAFPLVGVAVAAIGVAVRMGGETVWGPFVGTVLGMLAMVLATGAFHEDGLADTADGLWGGWTPEQRLEIMRDSRLGTYGTVALVGVLLVKIALLAGLDWMGFARAVLAGAVLGRASTLVAAAWLPAAGASSAGDVAGRATGRGALAAAVLALLAAFAGGGRWAPALLAVGVAVTWLGGRLLRARLGGITGDGLGAINLLVDVAVIAAVAGLVGAGLA